jgi:bifunctional non-homologous end joining protein LigD
MLARSGPIPTGRGWLFEPKLDGFRCLVGTHGGRFQRRNRRRWNMTNLLPKLAASLPANVQLDGEIVALNAEGVPDLHRLGSRLLHGRDGIPIVSFVFDGLAIEGLPVTAQPYVQRRALPEELDVEGQFVRVVATFENGEALFRAVCERGLGGVVAKRLRDPYSASRARLGQDEEPLDGLADRSASLPSNESKAPRESTQARDPTGSRP